MQFHILFLQTWKRKWVVVHKMTDLAAGTFAAKFILYSDEESSNQPTSDRQAFIFDHVTAVQHAKSKTHPLAFQIVQTAPVLMFSGLSERDTNDWMTSLKEIFWPGANAQSGGMHQALRESLCYSYSTGSNASDSSETSLQKYKRRYLV